MPERFLDTLASAQRQMVADANVHPLAISQTTLAACHAQRERANSRDGQNVPRKEVLVCCNVRRELPPRVVDTLDAIRLAHEVAKREGSTLAHLQVVSVEEGAAARARRRSIAASRSFVSTQTISASRVPFIATAARSTGATNEKRVPPPFRACWLPSSTLLRRC